MIYFYSIPPKKYTLKIQRNKNSPPNFSAKGFVVNQSSSFLFCSLITGFITVLCHQFIGLSPTQLNYPLSSRVNTKFLRCQYNGNKHLMFRTLFKQEKTFLLVFIVYSEKLKTSTIF